MYILGIFSLLSIGSLMALMSVDPVLSAINGTANAGDALYLIALPFTFAFIAYSLACIGKTLFEFYGCVRDL